MWQDPESTTQSSDQAINRIKAVNKLVYQPIRRFTKCLWHSQGNALGQSEHIGCQSTTGIAYHRHYAFLCQDICAYHCLVLPMLYACIMHNTYHDPAWRQGKPSRLLSLSDISNFSRLWQAL